MWKFRIWSIIMSNMEYEVLTNGEDKITEKKSVFIGAVASVHSEEEALEFVAKKKKEHYDARHNCFAYIIGDNDELVRSSDDGEPSGTAGRPMLDVMQGHHLHNVVVVVTRYFGGVLLGTGGLVRAYTQATEVGINACELMERHKGYPFDIKVDYTLLGKIQYLLNERKIFVEDTVYDADVTIKCYVPESEADALEKELVDQTGGKALLKKENLCAYGIADGKLYLF